MSISIKQQEKENILLKERMGNLTHMSQIRTEKKVQQQFKNNDNVIVSNGTPAGRAHKNHYCFSQKQENTGNLQIINIKKKCIG